MGFLCAPIISGVMYNYSGFSAAYFAMAVIIAVTMPICCIKLLSIAKEFKIAINKVEMRSSFQELEATVLIATGNG